MHEVTPRQLCHIFNVLGEDESRDKEGPSGTGRELVKLTQGSFDCL